MIARATDAPKINRIVERFHLNTVDKASVVKTMEKELDRNPILAKTGKSPQSLQHSEKENDIPTGRKQRTSVREELQKYREGSEKRKKAASVKDAGRNLPAGKKKGKER